MLGHNSDRNQSIFRSNPDTDYTRLANAFLQDPRLSYETKGLLCELLSRPDDWKIRAESIVKSGPAGRDKVWRMLREAEELGYAAKHQSRTEDGKFHKQDYVVTDDPQLLIERTAREINALLPRTGNPGAAIIPFPENTGAASGENGSNQGDSAAHGFSVRGEPRTEKPFTAQPCTANPTHTNKRELQKTEETKGAGSFAKVASAVAATFAAALPAAAAHHPVEQVMDAPAECWQTPKAKMEAGMNAMHARLQRQIWQTPSGLVEVAGAFKAELEQAYPLVDLKCGLATAAVNVKPESGVVNCAQTIHRAFGFMQQDAARRQKSAKAYEKPKPKSADDAWLDREWAEFEKSQGKS